MTEEERIAQEAAAAEQLPEHQPGDDDVKQVEIDGVTYDLDPETGNHLLNGQPFLDSEGVSFYNRSRERDKKLAKSNERITELENRKPEPVKPAESHVTRDQVLEHWRKKYPFATDEQLEMNLEMSESMTGAMLQQTLAPYQPLIGKMTSSDIIGTADSAKYPYLDKYKSEVEKVLSEGYPSLSRMNAEQKKMALENSYAVVEFRHKPEIEQDRIDGKKPTGKKDIAGFVKGSKGAAPVIGGETKSGLNANQLNHAVRLGLLPKTYADSLRQNRVTAKKNGKPEPELISDPVS